MLSVPMCAVAYNILRGFKICHDIAEAMESKFLNGLIVYFEMHKLKIYLQNTCQKPVALDRKLV